MEEKVIRVAKLPKPSVDTSDVDDLLATVCFYYGYTYKQARQLPHRRIVRLIRKAEQLKAREYYELTQIVAAPHTKDGKGVSALLKRYESQARNG